MSKRMRKSATSTMVQVIHEVWKLLPDGEKLCYQSCTYHYPEGHSDNRYRFIRRDANGNLKAQRGQAGASHADFVSLIVAMEKRLKTPVETFLKSTSVEVSDDPNAPHAYSVMHFHKQIQRIC